MKFSKIRLDYSHVGTIFLILVILCIPLILAQLAITKTFDSKVGKYGELTLKNSIGTNVAKYQVTYNTNTCLDKCSTGGTATIYQDMPLFTEADFYNRLGNKVKIMDYKFQIEKSKLVLYEEPLLKEVCKVLENLSTSCHYEPNGVIKKPYTDYYYQDYNGETLKAGTYNWRMEITKSFEDDVDFIPVLQTGNTKISMDNWIWYDGNYEHCKNIKFIFNSSPDYRYQEPVAINFTLNSTDQAFFWMLFTGYNNTNYSVYYNSIRDMRLVNKACEDSGTSQLIEIITNSSEILYGARLFIWYDNDFNKTEGNLATTGGWDNDFAHYNSSIAYREPFSLKYTQGGETSITHALNSSYQNVYATVMYYDRTYAGQNLFFFYNGTTLFIIGFTGTSGDFYISYYTGTTEAPYDTNMTRTNMNNSWVPFKVYSTPTGTYGYVNNVPWNLSTPWTLGTGLSKVGVNNLGLEQKTWFDSWMVSSYNISLYANKTRYIIGSELDKPSGLVVTSYKPVLNEKFNYSSINFNCSSVTGLSSTGVLSINLYIDDILKYTLTNSSTYQNLSFEHSEDVLDGTHSYFCNGTDNGGYTSQTSGKAFTVDTVHPVINITYPLNTTYSSGYVYSNIKVIDINWTITEVNPDKCVIRYRGVNYSTTCTSNATRINLTYGSESFSLWANDTHENSNITTRSFTYTPNVIQNSMNFSRTTSVGALEYYYLNITYDTSFSGINVILAYNNTANYTATTTDTGATRYYTASLTVPSTGVTTNNTLKFIVQLTNTTGLYNLYSGTYNQTVENRSLDDCSDNSLVLLNLTMYDENSLALMNGTIETSISLYSLGTRNLITSFNKTFYYVVGNDTKVCINAMTTNFSMDYTIRHYGNETYFKRFRSIQNMTLRNNSLPNTIKLYNLATDSGGYAFKITVVGNIYTSNGNKGLLVDTQKRYLYLNEFKSVESAVTANDGITTLHLIPQTEVYNFVVSYMGQTLGTFTNYQVQCQNVLYSQCSVVLNLATASSTVEDYTTYGNITTSFYFDRTGHILYTTYSATDGNAHNINQLVLKADNNGSTSICNGTSFGTSGTLICNIPVTYQNTTFLAELYSDGIYIGRHYFSQGDAPNFYGVDIFIELMMFSTLTLLFISNPILIIMGAVIGMTLSLVLISLTDASLTSMITASIFYAIGGFIIIWQIARRL